MITFFCTRCGTRLEIEPELAGRYARCSHCSNRVRTPGLETDEIPFARVVGEPAAAEGVDGPADEEAGPLLSYVPAWPERHEAAVLLDQQAERLEHVDGAEEEGPDTMTNCSYCGSTIARFIRKCPFCRHALWGV